MSLRLQLAIGCPNAGGAARATPHRASGHVTFGCTPARCAVVLPPICGARGFFKMSRSTHTRFETEVGLANGKDGCIRYVPRNVPPGTVRCGGARASSAFSARKLKAPPALKGTNQITPNPDPCHTLKPSPTIHPRAEPSSACAALFCSRWRLVSLMTDGRRDPRFGFAAGE
ncbi:uncharacterized protein B0H64DRAFT_54691 [Chaetomium fimeti]|uniref:Uncharacterized protein n=1 Tax=Chaetomium fimeti TaxID=1854472 RepID=A0AAE0H6R1_9PEZI|nr:hypothetical protein B0H64DRAFT_54691 [Chaetomium fimeti]